MFCNGEFFLPRWVRNCSQWASETAHCMKNHLSLSLNARKALSFVSTEVNIEQFLPAVIEHFTFQNCLLRWMQISWKWVSGWQTVVALCVDYKWIFVLHPPILIFHELNGWETFFLVPHSMELEIKVLSFLIAFFASNRKNTKISLINIHFSDGN